MPRPASGLPLPRVSNRHRLHRAQRDVAPHLLALELDLLRGLIRLAARLLGGLAQPRDVEHPAAGGDDLVAVLRRPGVEDLYVKRVDRAEALDDVALRGRLGIAL